MTANEIHNFIWGWGNSSTKKNHLIKCETIMHTYPHGGLAIRDPILMNKGIGARLACSFINQEEYWWEVFLKEKYLRKE